MAAAPLLLSGVWTNQNPRGYWLSEKFDGVRAYWTGAQVLSRNAIPLHVPAGFSAHLPTGVAIDGELWCGRGRYLDAMAACKSEAHPAWGEMYFMAFDLPHHAGTFEERQAALAAMRFGNRVRVVQQVPCEGRRHMKTELRSVHALGGEGLMLREAGSRYVPERSRTLLKVRWQNNTELL
jgi:DNA ligase-1